MAGRPRSAGGRRSLVTAGERRLRRGRRPEVEAAAAMIQRGNLGGSPLIKAKGEVTYARFSYAGNRRGRCDLRLLGLAILRTFLPFVGDGAPVAQSQRRFGPRRLGTAARATMGSKSLPDHRNRKNYSRSWRTQM